MHVDLGNVLAETAAPGVSRGSLDRLDEAIATAHDRIMRGRRDDEFGYAALNLPSRTDAAALREAVSPVADAEQVLTIGIGGSALGATTVSRALDIPGHVVLDNIDPGHVRRVLGAVDFEDTAVNVVSRSGRTTETLANFLVVREAFADAGVDWTARTIVTTGESGPLREFADRHEVPVIDVPAGVPGRYSVLSAVGLVPAVILDGDISGVLAGAQSVSDALTGSLFDCAPYAYAAVMAALSRRGITVNVLMPYTESLEPFAEWFAQLWAESLGKDGVGMTPVQAMGVTDQHSQLQLYRAGPRNTVVTFVRPVPQESVLVEGAEDVGVEFLEGVSLGEVVDAEFRATEASLATARRPNVRLEIEELDAAGLGELFYGMEVACVMVAELQGVNPFDQPAVEWGKRATRNLLSGDGGETVRAVSEKETFRV